MPPNATHAPLRKHFPRILGDGLSGARRATRELRRRDRRTIRIEGWVLVASSLYPLQWNFTPRALETWRARPWTPYRSRLARSFQRRSGRSLGACCAGTIMSLLYDEPISAPLQMFRPLIAAGGCASIR